MKCVCGYEYEEEFSKDIKAYISTIGDDEFKKIHGTFLCESYGWNQTKYEVSLYAYPKCNTAQLVD